MTKQGALEELITSMFNDAELRSFLGQMPDTAPLLAGLPDGSASLLRVIFETIRILERHGIIDAEFFAALVAARPRLRPKITEVAATWGLTLTPASEEQAVMGSTVTPPKAASTISPSTHGPAMPMPAGSTTLPADVAILIALEEEWEVFWPIAGEPGGVKDDSGGYLYHFEVPCAVGRPYRCVALFMGAMGPGQATHATARLLAARPLTVVNIGIAAAIHDDLKLCDVVVAEQVDDFLSTVKAVPKGKDGWAFELRGSVYRTTHALVQDLINLKFAHRDAFTRWRSACAPAMAERAGQLGKAIAAKHLREEPAITKVHLASGPVLAAAESFSKWIRTRDGLLKALEMEAAGMMLAAQQQADPARTLVLRGISDFGDERKAQTDRDSGGAFRHLAMFNATQLLWAMMQKGLLPRHEPTGATAGARSRSSGGPRAEASSGRPVPSSLPSDKPETLQDDEIEDRSSTTVSVPQPAETTTPAKAVAVNDEIDRMLEADEPEVWGLHAADPKRQALVDAALDRCTPVRFCALIRAIAQQQRTPSLGLIGAHEALFTAAARRLYRGNFDVPGTDLPAWHQLVELQIGSLEVSGVARHPYTRQGEHFEGGETFWADAWTFSLRIPPPSKFEHAELAWYFPGWARQLDSSPMPEISPLLPSEGTRRMVGMAFEVLPKLAKEPLDVELPRVLLPAMIILAPSRGWRITTTHVSALSGTLEEKILAGALIQRPPDERARIADILWDVLPFMLSPDPKLPVTERLERLNRSSRVLLPFVMANLSEATLSRTIIGDGIGLRGHDISPLLSLPRALRRVVARAALMAAPGKMADWMVARTIGRLFDSADDVEFIVNIIRESNENVAAEFTGFVWRVAPLQALDEAEDAFVHGRASAPAWFFHAPQANLPPLLKLVEESSRSRPPWVQNWAKKRALEGGPFSAMLFNVARAGDDGDSKQPRTQQIENTSVPPLEPDGAGSMSGQSGSGISPSEDTSSIPPPPPPTEVDASPGAEGRNARQYGPSGPKTSVAQPSISSPTPTPGPALVPNGGAQSPPPGTDARQSFTWSSTPDPTGHATAGLKNSYGGLELALDGVQGGFRVVLRVTDPGSDAEPAPTQGPAAIDVVALLAAQAGTAAYGRLLTDQVFADARVRERFLIAKAAFESRGLLIRLRVAIDRTAEALHALRWELLQDPSTYAPLATSERILFSRFMTSQDSRPIQLRPRTEMRAVIAVSAPLNCSEYGLADVVLGSEVDRARGALAGISVTTIGEGKPWTLEHFKAALREGVDIVYLVCHGSLTEALGSVVYLQNHAGMVVPVKAAELARQVSELPHAPRLMVLASCESAGREDASTAQMSLAPLLANAGVPAVLAMQGKISMDTVQIAMPMFFKELLKDGQIDRALAVARSAVRERPDFWMPALFLRLKGGRMWSEPTGTTGQGPSERVSSPGAGRRQTGAVGPGSPRAWDAKAVLTRILQEGPQVVVTWLDECLPGEAAKLVESPVEAAQRIAGKIDALGDGVAAAQILIPGCKDTLAEIKVAQPAMYRAAQATICTLLSEWMPRRYDADGTLARAIASEHSAPDLDVCTDSLLVAEFHTASADDRRARVDRKRLQGQGRLAVPQAAGAEMLAGDELARQVVDDMIKDFPGQYEDTPGGRLKFAQERLENLRYKTARGTPGPHYDPRDFTLTEKAWAELVPGAARTRLKELLPAVRHVTLTAPVGGVEARLKHDLITIFRDDDSGESSGA